MFYSFISVLNWIDILIIVILLRMGYIGIKKGFGIEAFKTLNLFFCSFVALHFYIILGEFIHSKIPVFPIGPASIFCYVLLIFIITIIFRILREGFFVFFKIETISGASKFFGLLLGFFRGLLISGLIMFGLLSSENHYIELSARTSAIGSKVVVWPVKIYESMFYAVANKIFPSQGFNQEVINVLTEEPKEKNKETTKKTYLLL